MRLDAIPSAMPDIKFKASPDLPAANPAAILPIDFNAWQAGYAAGWNAHEHQTKIREDQLCQSIARLEKENAELHDEINSLRLSNSILVDA